jgi:hypothetical protein
MDQVVLHTTTAGPEAEIERALFALIQAHAHEPAPFILYLADRIASHEIVTRMRLVPVRDRSLSFSDSCRTITSSLKGDA